MNRLITCCVSFALMLLATSAFCDDAGLARLFSDRKISGTLLIANLEGTALYLHDEARANKPLLPASTFKIPNTLIALDEGVITEQDLLKWDGTDRGLAAWNRDQTLSSAFKSSCVWCYQELAQRIGIARYQQWLKKIDYGNALPQPGLTSFWLSGDLRISAVQQMLFLHKLYKRELPFKASSYDALRRIMLMEEKPSYRLYAKTGWAGYGEKVTPQIGWYVGYVETGTDVWFFALNMDITKPAEGAYRQQMVMEALKLKGIIR